MAESIVITVLVENTVYSRGLLAEHGLALHLQVGDRGLLFDTGQSDLLLRNARQLGVDLAATEAIVLSHGHNDHTGGLAPAREAAPKAMVFLHPSALAPKFARASDGTGCDIGMEQASAELLRRAGQQVVPSSKPTEVLPGVFITGEIPRRTEFEDTGGPFFLDAACAHPDPLLDDQGLFFDTDRGLVVLLGCGHAGVVNTLEYIQGLTGGRPVRAVLGGMHLWTASRQRMDQTFASLGRWDIERLVHGHCTGVSATSELCAAFPGHCAPCSVGLRMRFDSILPA